MTHSTTLKVYPVLRQAQHYSKLGERSRTKRREGVEG